MNEKTPPEYGAEIAECFTAMSGGIYRFLRSLVQGDKALCEDLVQVTFEKAWKAWPELRSLTEEARGAWLFKVAFNTAIDALRREKTALEKWPQVYVRYGAAAAGD